MGKDWMTCVRIDSSVAEAGREVKNSDVCKNRMSVWSYFWSVTRLTIVSSAGGFSP
jgi:hypothetical protein